MSKTIIVFSMDGCTHCKSLKKRLTSEGLEYNEIEVLKNKSIWDSVVEQTKLDYVPTVFIRSEGSPNGPVFCPERDFENEDELLELIKFHLNEEKED